MEHNPTTVVLGVDTLDDNTCLDIPNDKLTFVVAIPSGYGGEYGYEDGRVLAEWVPSPFTEISQQVSIIGEGNRWRVDVINMVGWVKNGYPLKGV